MSALNVAEGLNYAQPETAAVPAAHPTRPLFWSVRRELWENPSLVVAPAAVATLIVLAILIAAIRFGGQTLVSADSNPAGIAAMALVPFGFPSVFLLVTMAMVAVFYSLSALQSERRDRSLLFWKSLPVSDRTTVLSKFAVPFVLLPAITFVLALAALLLVLIIENATLLAHHGPVAILWSGMPWFSLVGVLFYATIVVTLWFAPIYSWFLLVSAWARRAAFLWAVIPWVVLANLEKVSFHTHYVREFLARRAIGFSNVAFAHNPSISPDQPFVPLSALTPLHLLADPGFWGGLLFTAAAIAVIIRLRRRAEPF